MICTGPVSTTLSATVAAGFAGKMGQLIELYPSFDKRGLDVSCLSDYPEEKEVLYLDCSFQIANIYHSQSTEYKDFKALIDESHSFGSQPQSESTKQRLSSFLRAIQIISVDSRGTDSLSLCTFYVFIIWILLSRISYLAERGRN